MNSTRLAVFALVPLLAALVISVEITKLRSPSTPKPDQQSDSSPVYSRDPRPRQASRLNVGSLCDRLRRAEKNKTSDAVYRKIVAELLQLDAERVLGLLAAVDTTSGDDVTRGKLRAALFDVLCSFNRALASDYALSAPEDKSLQYQASANFHYWLIEGAREPYGGFIDWLDTHSQVLSGNVFLFNKAEAAAVSHLFKSKPTAAMERVKQLPAGQVRDIVIGAFECDWRALAPDQAIDFLRESLSRVGHEKTVGRACGLQLYREDESAIQAFFRKHDTTREEGEAILFQTVRLDMKMGLDAAAIGAFHDRMRSIAEVEGFGNANDLTAVILGLRSDRDHQDKQAVDELFSYVPGASSLEIFLSERGESMDAAQRTRVTERLRLLHDSPNATQSHGEQRLIRSEFK